MYYDAAFTVTITETPLQRSVTGYGSKLPTPYMANCSDGRARRVYAICYSNCASFYIIIKGKRAFLRDHELEDARDAALTIKGGAES
jgi:hypothetical protein